MPIPSDAALVAQKAMHDATYSTYYYYYCEFAFKPGVDFAGINFDLFLQAFDRRTYFGEQFGEFWF